MHRTIEYHNEHHPMDVVESTVGLYEWQTQRSCDTEILVQAPGKWCDLSLHFVWSDNAEAMQFNCAFDMRVPKARQGEVHELLMRVNERLWLGHFTLWAEEGLPMYRHALPLRGAIGPTREQVQDMVETAMYECERFYPAFQFVIWGGYSAEQAIEAAMLETVGEA
ncbi:MAG: YbjN domain-containing protein [Alphaproteobacteria bacterium]|nr:YbjN domain-containing protein [Alphaproteobacteria bacterium]MBF0250002.1 YbjN domain-containing protein [Alphaproteobacteria bacterium]